MTQRKAMIETITKGPTQRVRRTVGYRLITLGEFGGDKKVIAQFDISADDPDAALTAAQNALYDFNHQR